MSAKAASMHLQQGDYDRETRYADDPVRGRDALRRCRARSLHLVDLDAARAGGYTLATLLRRIADDGRLQVQTGGGVRDEAAVASMLEHGASRVVVGWLAVREPAAVEAWLQRYGAERITIALDTRQDEAGAWQLPIHGCD